MIKAVIFDKDGVIVDSEPIQFQSFQETVAEYGGIFTLDDHKNLSLGKSGTKSYKIIAEKYNITDIEIFIQKRRERYRKLAEEKLQIRTGAFKLIRQLHKHYLLAVASGSSEKLLHYDLDKFNLSHFFKVIVSSQYLKSKPDPEVFLVAAEKLRMDPKNCLVIEDTEMGVQAAKSAGMYCIAVPHEISAHQDFSKADLVVNSLEKVDLLITKNSNLFYGK